MNSRLVAGFLIVCTLVMTVTGAYAIGSDMDLGQRIILAIGTPFVLLLGYLQLLAWCESRDD